MWVNVLFHENASIGFSNSSLLQCLLLVMALLLSRTSKSHAFTTSIRMRFLIRGQWKRTNTKISQQQQQQNHLSETSSQLMRNTIMSVQSCRVNRGDNFCYGFIHPHQYVSSGSVAPRNLCRHSGKISSLTQLNLMPLPSLASVQSILHADPMYCLTAILLISTAGIQLERRTTLGKALSAPLATMALALFLANVGGVIPFVSPVYNMINSYLVSLAVPMLLFDSDLRRVVRDTGSLLLAFFVGAVATVVGTIIAYPLLPMKSLGSDVGWKVASALAARHIGGAINFVAVAETLRIPGTVVSAAIAADNVVVALYFAFLFAIAKEEKDDVILPSESASIPIVETELDDYTLVPAPAAETTISSTKGLAVGTDEISLATIAMSISVSATLVTIGNFITRTMLPSGTSSLPLTSVLTVVAATIYPSFFYNIRKAGSAVGIIFIQMFFAASGAAGSIALVLKQAPSLFAFSALQIGIHFAFLMSVGVGIFHLPARELYLSSNANVGGPTTAAAMAQAKNWKLLILPALLIGILGYATATGIALALGPLLVRLPLRI